MTDRAKVLETIAELERRIAVQMAWLNGALIECRDLDNPKYKWMQVETPIWDWDDFDYRVCNDAPVAPAIYVAVLPDLEQEFFTCARNKKKIEAAYTNNTKIVKYIPCEDEE